MQIYQKPGYHIEQGHLICLFAHLALKIKCVLDVMSLSNIWLGDLFSNNKNAYDRRGQLANTQILNKGTFFHYVTSKCRDDDVYLLIIS